MYGIRSCTNERCVLCFPAEGIFASLCKHRFVGIKGELPRAALAIGLSNGLTIILSYSFLRD